MRERHGAAYAYYASTTPSLVPSIQHYKSGTRWQFDPRDFQAGLRDVFWFFAAMCGLHIVMELHEAGLLSVYWRAF